MSVLEVLRCFRSPPGLPLRDPRRWARGFPHSDIDGSRGVGPLPVASRSRTASFIGSPTPGHSPFAVFRFERTRALARVISPFPPVNLLRSRGGDAGARTPNLLRAREALSQLSYIPPSTPRGDAGWAFLDSNQRPQSYQDCALTS